MGWSNPQVFNPAPPSPAERNRTRQQRLEEYSDDELIEALARRRMLREAKAKVKAEIFCGQG